MRKHLQRKDLRFAFDGGDAPAYRASAFSLAELVVALGILVLMFALAGQVFNFTIQSTGEATAIVEINQQLRALEQTLRDDLAFVEQGRTMILIQGNPVNAYWSLDDKDADDDGNPATGYPRPSDPEREYPSGTTTAPIPPRADMLMFFTSRRANSYTDSAVTADLQQVVYGHAELGEYEVIPAGSSGVTTFAFKGIVGNQGAQTNAPMFPVDANGYPSPTTVCPVPASRWHLARRGVLIAPTYAPRNDPPGLGPTNGLKFAPVTRLDDVRLLDGTTDIIAHFELPNFSGGAGSMPPPFNYDDEVLRPAVFNPEYQSGDAQMNSMFATWQLPRIFVQGMNPYARSLLDVTPPPALASRLGAYLMPNCASFKVEWTLDPKSSFVAGRLDGLTDVLWFDPGFVSNANQFNPKLGMNGDDPVLALQNAIDAANQAGQADLARNLTSVMQDRNRHLDGYSYGLGDRIRSTSWGDSNYIFPPIGDDGRPNTVAFVANRFHLTTNELVPDDVFPSALRITVDVFDREGRLQRPLRHVMVIPVGR